MTAETAGNDPLTVFAQWFEEAKAKEANDPNAMALASVGADGMPSLRMVLLKDFDQSGFVFYTNYDSRKGTQLLAHPKAALLFHWKSLRRQARIEGSVTTVSDAEADAYFATRARQSQIGAWASAQSRPLQSRFELEARVAKYAAKHAIGAVPRPPYWSGFRVYHERVELWREGAFRLHDRREFRRVEGGWRCQRLYP